MHTFKKFYNTFLHSRTYQLIAILIVGIAIPLTLVSLQQTTKYQQHAAATNLCGTPISGNPNPQGICGNHGWGFCTTDTTCGNNDNFAYSNPSSDSACRGYDDKSGCCYPVYPPTPITGTKNNAGECSTLGAGMCLVKEWQGTLKNNIVHYAFNSITGSDACSEYFNQSQPNSEDGCIFLDPNVDRKSQISCSNSQCPITKDYNECESGNDDACTAQYGPSIKGHLTHVTYDCNGWHCQDLGTPAGQCGNPGAGPSPSVSPSVSPSPSPSPSPSSGPVRITLIIGLPGIGYNGQLGVLPKHLSRSITVVLYDAQTKNPSGPGTQALATAKGIVWYDSSSDTNSGYFVSKVPVSITLPTTPPANNVYEVLVQMPQYLYKLAVNTDETTTFTLQPADNFTINPLILIPGAVNTANGQTNHINAAGFTTIISCIQNAASCPKTTDGIPYADLNDNGAIDIIDLNLWLRSLSQLQQAHAPGCSVADCQGD